MYVATIPNRKSPPAILIRESVREGKKVRTRTIKNISKWPKGRIDILRKLLKGEFDETYPDTAEIRQGKAVGAIFALHELLTRTGIKKALGKGRNVRLAMLLILARLLDQGSRLSAVSWADEQSVEEVLGLRKFDENDLYKTLDWLCENQGKIEKRLFRSRFGSDGVPSLFLYDVTSSYFEGDQNELAEFGYNSDKKSGKKQIVIGLLTDDAGDPVAVRVFSGNTPDQSTVVAQVKTLADSFGVKNVTLVGDRGMLKGPQIESLPEGFRYITAIGKPTVRRLLAEGVLQYELFDNHVCEVESDGIRYILRRNPVRVKDMAVSRDNKFESLAKYVSKKNIYLAAHPKAKPETHLKNATQKAERLRISGWLRVESDGRILRIVEDGEILKSEALLDGCYVIKTDLPVVAVDAKTVHERYKDLAMIERNFRVMKTECLEVRPVYVRKESRTKGHVFVVMLALLLRRHAERLLRSHFAESAPPVDKALGSLDRLCTYEREVDGITLSRIIAPSVVQAEYLSAFGVTLPKKFVRDNLPRM